MLFRLFNFIIILNVCRGVCLALQLFYLSRSIFRPVAEVKWKERKITCNCTDVTRAHTRKQQRICLLNPINTQRAN
jgi:hypothetical protein